MATDWDDDDGWGNLDDELTPDEIAEIKRADQDANDGFTYEMMHESGNFFAMKCNKCGRVGDIREKPFPHKFDCPMRRFNGDDDEE